MRTAHGNGYSRVAHSPPHRRLYAIEALERRRLFALGMIPGATVNLNSQIGPDAADPVRDVAYVADQGNNQILAINTDTGTLAGAVATPAIVQGLAVSPDDTQLYASEPGAFQVQVFALPSLSLLSTLTNGAAINQIVGLTNNRFAGDVNGITVYSASTGLALFNLPGTANELIKANPAGTLLFSRARGLSGNDGSISVFDTSGIGAPVSLPSIPGQVGANSTDFAVNTGAGFAYLGDGGANGVEVTDLSSGVITTWNGGAPKAIAALDGVNFVYDINSNNVAEQFFRTGVEENQRQVGVTANPESLVMTPNGVAVYTFGTGIGILGNPTLNLAETPQLVFLTQPSASITEQTISPSVQVAIENVGGSVIANDTSDVTLTLFGAQGFLEGQTTVTAQGGIATFPDLSVFGTGNYTLQATDGIDMFGTSNLFPVTTPHLVILQQPSALLPGAIFSPVVRVAIEDSQGNIEPADDSIVTLALNTGTGTLLGTLSATAQNGIATFSTVALDTAGLDTLVASDGLDSSAISNVIDVTTAADTDHLTFIQQPTNTAPNGVMTPGVKVEVTTFGGALVNTDAPITLSANTGPGTLHGTVTVDAVNGVATFSDLSLAAAGYYTLAASSDAGSAAISSQFLIGRRMVFVQLTPSAIAGQRIEPSVMVEVLDQNNNVVTTDNSAVSISVGGGPSSDLLGVSHGAFVDGIAEFKNLSLDEAGLYTLTATDNDGSTAASSDLSILPSLPTHLVFVAQPRETTAGVRLRSIVVAVEDQFGNVVTSSSSFVRLTLATAPAHHGRHNVRVRTLAGLAVFSSVTLTAAGAYTFKATDRKLPVAFSDSFNIDPVAAATLRLLEQPIATAAKTPRPRR